MHTYGLFDVDDRSSSKYLCISELIKYSAAEFTETKQFSEADTEVSKEKSLAMFLRHTWNVQRLLLG